MPHNVTVSTNRGMIGQSELVRPSRRIGLVGSHTDNRLMCPRDTTCGLESRRCTYLALDVHAAE